MDRRSQQNHIRAARDWLGRAEDSLSRENDVQGDLKLMLAKAELAHVGHCPRSRTLLLWGRRLAALLVAVGLVAALWQPEGKSTVPVPADNSMTAASSQQSVALDNSPAEKQPELPPAVPVAETPEKYPSQPTPVTESAPARAAEAVAPPPVSPAAKQHQLPDANKQQLMQSAGKILRQ